MPISRPLLRSLKPQTGVAVLIIVVAMLLVASAVILASFSASQKSTMERAIETRASSSSFDQAIANFVATNKRLPCPASPTDGNGLEAATTPFTTCTAATGVLPWGALGLKFDDALDKWGRKYSYRVFSGNTGFTQIDGLNAINCNTAALLTATQVAIDANGKCATSPNSTMAPDFYTGKGLIVNDKGVVVSGVAYVIISHGATGRGSYGADHSATRSTLPTAGGRELINTTAPVDNTYWILDASAVGADPANAAFFDDIVSYKSVTELLTAANALPRDWGWVTLSQAFAPTNFAPNADPAQTTTLTITLTNSSTTQATLLRSFVQTLPTNLVGLPTPAASTTCGGAPAFTVAANATSITFPVGKTIPAATVAAGVKTNGTCTFSVTLTSIATSPTTTNFTNTISVGANACPTSPFTAVSYLCTDAGWNIDATTANVTAALDGPTINGVSPTSLTASASPQIVTLNGLRFVTGATVRFTNLTTSAATTVASTFVTALQLTSSFVFGLTPATWSIVVINPDGQQSAAQNITILSPSQSFTAASLTAAGVTLAGGAAGCVATSAVDIGPVRVTASGVGARFVSASVDGIGASTAGCTTGSTATSAAGVTESLLFTHASTGFRYLGIKFASFSNNGGGLPDQPDDELVRITFFNAVGAALTPTVTLRACNTSTLNSATSNFYLDAGQLFKGFSVTPLNRADAVASTVRVGSVQFCTVGPANACIPPAPSATNCP